MSVSGLSNQLGQAPLDGLDSIYADSITTNTLDVTTAFLGLPVGYYTGATSNLQSQIDDITGQLAGQTGNWGVFWCDATLNNPTANVARYAYVNNSDPHNLGVYMDGSAGGGLYEALKVDEAGVYNLQFSCQLTHTSSNKHDVKIWFRKNGTDIAASASVLSLLGNDENEVPAWNYILDLSAGDYVSVMWSCDTTQFSLPAIAAQTTPVVVPSIPSVILTIQQVTNLAAGPAGPAGNTPNLTVGTVQAVAYGNSPQVTITGTTTDPILNFVLETGPQGPQGTQGPQGPQGPAGTISQAQYDDIMASASAAGASAGAAAGATAGGVAGEAAATAVLATIEGEIATIQGEITALEGQVTGLETDVATLQGQVSTLETDVGVLQDKTVNITSATPSVDTTFSGAIICSEYGSGSGIIMSATNAISIQTPSSAEIAGATYAQVVSDTAANMFAPIISINSGTTSGTINIGESLLDAIYIQGLPFVNINWNTTGFSQW